VSAEAVVDTIDFLVEELRIAMFCAGAGDLAALRQPGRLVKGE
jgi:isopentenyl diphosphate isomerase/L-lactate dehydrogenase-like FMN-dependent dehydrogenase